MEYICQMARPTFFPFLFDSRRAWEQVITSPSWHPDISFEEFMHLYQYFRSGRKAVNISHPKEEIQAEPKHTPFLSQAEIDALLDTVTLNDANNTPTTAHKEISSAPLEDANFNGILSQSDIDSLFQRM